jgi:hypothetical protein
MATRPIYEIAAEIRSDWKKVWFGAVPYLEAMESLDSVEDYFFCDSAQTIIVYFLGNANAWRGETARRVKKELHEMIK